MLKFCGSWFSNSTFIGHKCSRKINEVAERGKVFALLSIGNRMMCITLQTQKRQMVKAVKTRLTILAHRRNAKSLKPNCNVKTFSQKKVGHNRPGRDSGTTAITVCATATHKLRSIVCIVGRLCRRLRVSWLHLLLATCMTNSE